MIPCKAQATPRLHEAAVILMQGLVRAMQYAIEVTTRQGWLAASCTWLTGIVRESVPGWLLQAPQQRQRIIDRQQTRRSALWHSHVECLRSLRIAKRRKPRSKKD